MRILLVEDDELLGDGLNTALLSHGYVVDWMKDGLAATQAIRNENFELIVLDLGLPRRSGLEVLQEIRARGLTTPVLILTASDTIEDRVKGLDAGADDYLTKPFDLHELFARIRALQRRSTAQISPTIVYGDIEVDTAGHVVHFHDQPMDLSRREFALLLKLLQNAGRVLSREQLTQSLYGWGDEIDSNALEVHIHNLRKKFGSQLIKTIRGIGYMVEKLE